MKKLLSLLLALVLTFSLAACGGGAGDKNSKVNDSKEEATEVVEGFMDAYIDFDFADLEDYVDDFSDLPEEIQELDFSSALDEIIDEMPDGLSAYRDDWEDVFNRLFDIAKECMDYKITDVNEESKDEYIFTVDLTVPDFESVDFDSLVTNAMSEDTMMDLVTMGQASGELSEAPTEEEIMAFLAPTIIQKINDALYDVEFETESQEIELVVVEENNEWMIDASKSDLD